MAERTGRPQGGADSTQSPSAEVRGTRPEDTGHRTGHTAGRPTSWIAVALIVTGFVVGGFGLLFLSPLPWLVWVGVALAVVGGVFGLVTGIMDDVH